MAEQPGSVQMFRLQIVDAENNVVCRFAMGGDVEIDLVETCTREIQKTWVPPAEQFSVALTERMPSLLGFTRTRRAIQEATSELASWRNTGENSTDYAIAVAIRRVILDLKKHTVTILRDRSGARI